MEKNQLTNEGVLLGRYLFYDSSLSLNNKMSCANCHKQAFAFSDSPNAFSKGNYYPTSRNSMPLFNLIWSPTFFWDGRAKSLEEQVFHPLSDTNEINIDWKRTTKRLQGSKFYRKLFFNAFNSYQVDSLKIAYSLSQFVKSLISYQSKYDSVLKGLERFSKEELEGFEIANDQSKGDCLHCHITDGGVLGTNFQFSNNGLTNNTPTFKFLDNGRGKITKNKEDNGKFKIPSLRNLQFTAPYMHDGRFSTLEEVVSFYSNGVKYSPTIDPKMSFAHQGGAKLSLGDQKKLLAFLKTMSDSNFISDPKFSNPFAKKKTLKIR